MPKNLKEIMENEFDKSRNYNAVLSKVKGGISMKKFALIPVTVIVLIVLVVGLYHFGENAERKRKSIIYGDDIIITVNKLKGPASSSQLDIDIKIVEIEKMEEKFEFVKNLKLPDDVKLISSSCYYTRERNSDEYNTLHDYIIRYTTEGGNDKDIQIAFSKIGKPLKCVVVVTDNKDISVIGNVELEISEVNGTYMATFYFDNMNFDIEAKGLSLDEFVELLKSIVA